MKNVKWKTVRSIYGKVLNKPKNSVTTHSSGQETSHLGKQYKQLNLRHKRHVRHWTVYHSPQAFHYYGSGIFFYFCSTAFKMKWNVQHTCTSPSSEFREGYLTNEKLWPENLHEKPTTMYLSNIPSLVVFLSVNAVWIPYLSSVLKLRRIGIWKTVSTKFKWNIYIVKYKFA